MNRFVVVDSAFMVKPSPYSPWEFVIEYYDSDVRDMCNFESSDSDDELSHLQESDGR